MEEFRIFGPLYIRQIEKSIVTKNDTGGWYHHSETSG
jgi:hypothetical protein